MKFLSLYIDLRYSFPIFLNLFFSSKQETYKCSDKTSRICQNYLNETNEFTMSNGQVLEIRRETDYH